jgi:hypothetical protein
MRFLLSFELFADPLKLSLHALDLAPRAFALPPIQLRGAGQPPLGAIHDRGRHLQIAQQFGMRRRALLPLRFEEQLRRLQQPLADRARTLAPGGVQLAGFAHLRAALREDGGHPLAVIQTLACYWRQELHGHLRRDLPLPHLLLDRFRQNLHQRQPPRHPAHAAVEAPGQLLQPVAEALLQCRQQPAHFQSRLRFGEAQRAVQQYRGGLAQRPHHRFHRVPPQLLQRRDPLVAIDDHVTIRLIFGRHHHDGRLLARFRQRGQQPPLPRRMLRPQSLPSPVKLVKLQSHGRHRFGISMEPPGTGLLRRAGEVLRERA